MTGSDRRLLLILLLMMGRVCVSMGQGTDSIPTASVVAPVGGETQLRNEQQQRVHRTTVWAACLPGAGQLANQKYWKAPIVWGAMGYMVDYCAFNVKQFRYAKAQLRAETDDDPATVNDSGLTSTALTESAIFYRRNRDLAVMGILGIHLLSVLDANVDAHLMDFDISDDLKASLFCEPFSAQAGIRLCW